MPKRSWPPGPNLPKCGLGGSSPIRRLMTGGVMLYQRSVRTRLLSRALSTSMYVSDTKSWSPTKSKSTTSTFRVAFSHRPSSLPRSHAACSAYSLSSLDNLGGALNGSRNTDLCLLTISGHTSFKGRLGLLDFSMILSSVRIWFVRRSLTLCMDPWQRNHRRLVLDHELRTRRWPSFGGLFAKAQNCC